MLERSRSHGDNQRRRGTRAHATIAMRHIRIEVHRIALLHLVVFRSMLNGHCAFQQVKELASWMLMRFTAVHSRQKLCKIGIQRTVWHHIAQTLKVIGWLVRTRLRKTCAFLAPMDAKERPRFRFEEVVQIFRKHHCNACKVSEGRNDAPGLQLRQKARRKTSVSTKFYQAHGFFETECLDTFTNSFLGYERFGILTFDLNASRIGECVCCHGAPLSAQSAQVRYRTLAQCLTLNTMFKPVGINTFIGGLKIFPFHNNFDVKYVDHLHRKYVSNRFLDCMNIFEPRTPVLGLCTSGVALPYCEHPEISTGRSRLFDGGSGSDRLCQPRPPQSTVVEPSQACGGSDRPAPWNDRSAGMDHAGA